MAIINKPLNSRLLLCMAFCFGFTITTRRHVYSFIWYEGFVSCKKRKSDSFISYWSSHFVRDSNYCNSNTNNCRKYEDENLLYIQAARRQVEITSLIIISAFFASYFRTNYVESSPSLVARALYIVLALTSNLTFLFELLPLRRIHYSELLKKRERGENDQDDAE